MLTGAAGNSPECQNQFIQRTLLNCALSALMCFQPGKHLEALAPARAIQREVLSTLQRYTPLQQDDGRDLLTASLALAHMREVRAHAAHIREEVGLPHPSHTHSRPPSTARSAAPNGSTQHAQQTPQLRQQQGPASRQGASHGGPSTATPALPCCARSASDAAGQELQRLQQQPELLQRLHNLRKSSQPSSPSAAGTKGPAHWLNEAAKALEGLMTTCAEAAAERSRQRGVWKGAPLPPPPHASSLFTDPDVLLVARAVGWGQGGAQEEGIKAVGRCAGALLPAEVLPAQLTQTVDAVLVSRGGEGMCECCVCA